MEEEIKEILLEQVELIQERMKELCERIDCGNGADECDLMDYADFLWGFARNDFMERSKAIELLKWGFNLIHPRLKKCKDKRDVFRNITFVVSSISLIQSFEQKKKDCEVQ